MSERITIHAHGVKPRQVDEVVAVLHRLQQFEPAGVCTRDLQECLLVQLR